MSDVTCVLALQQTMKFMSKDITCWTHEAEPCMGRQPWEDKLAEHCVGRWLDILLL